MNRYRPHDNAGTMATPSPNPYLAGRSPHSDSHNQQQQPPHKQQQQQPPHKQQQQQQQQHPYRRYNNENQSTRNQTAVMHQQQQHHQQHQHQQQPHHAAQHNPYHNPYHNRNRSSQAAAVEPKTALTLLQEHRAAKSKRLYLLQRSSTNNSNHSSTKGGDEKDAWLSLGNGIHELAGEAGTGKTQVALSLCMQAAVTPVTSTSTSTSTTTTTTTTTAVESPHTNPGSSKTGCRAIYISLGKASMPKVLQRLSQMAEAWTLQNSATHTATERPSSVTGVHQVLTRIMTRAVVNQDDLFDLLRHEMPALLEQEIDCQVLVLDSVADLFRGMNHEVKASNSNSSTSMSMSSIKNKRDNKNLAADRSATLFALAAILKQFSDKYQIPIVVLNQVTARISNQPSSSSFSSSSNILPALGLSWANCVNTSYILTRQETMAMAATGGSNPSTAGSTSSTVFVRKISLRLSSTAACSQTACLQIEPQGVRLVQR